MNALQTQPAHQPKPFLLSDNKETIHAAIEQKRLVGFFLKGFWRVAELHILGITRKGRPQVLFYQLNDVTEACNGSLWRRANLDEIQGLEILPAHFTDRGATAHGWDSIQARVGGGETGTPYLS